METLDFKSGKHIEALTIWLLFCRTHFQIVFFFKLCIFIQIYLEFVPKGPIDGKSALVQIMAWCRTGSKSLPESMLSTVLDAIRRP